MQQEDPALVQLAGGDIGDAIRFDVLPVQSPSRPVDRGQPELLAGGGRCRRHPAERRPIPATALSGHLLDRLESAHDVVAAALGGDPILALMVVAVQTDLVPAIADLFDQRGPAEHLGRDHEEGGMRARCVEGVEYRRGGVNVRAVIERNDGTALGGDQLQTWNLPPAPAPAGVESVHTLPHRLRNEGPESMATWKKSHRR